jgi:hypothetical protein
MFEAFANAMPLHRVKRIDALPPWETDLERHRFLCVMCDVLMNGTELADSDWHVFVSAPCPGWELASCLVCGEWTVPTVENTKKCDYCTGVQWWKPRSQK